MYIFGKFRTISCKSDENALLSAVHSSKAPLKIGGKKRLCVSFIIYVFRYKTLFKLSPNFRFSRPEMVFGFDLSQPPTQPTHMGGLLKIHWCLVCILSIKRTVQLAHIQYKSMKQVLKLVPSVENRIEKVNAFSCRKNVLQLFVNW